MNASGRWLLSVLVAGLLGLAIAVSAEEGTSPLRWRQSPASSEGRGSSRVGSYEALRATMLGLPQQSTAGRHKGQGAGSEWSNARRGRGFDGYEPAWLPLPSPSLEDPVAVYDPLRQRVIAFGGDSYPDYLNETRIWVLALRGTPGWSELVPTGPSPLPREAHTAIYDPVRDRVLVFGGWGGWDGRGMLNDVWALTLEQAAGFGSVRPQTQAAIAR